MDGLSPTISSEVKRGAEARRVGDTSDASLQPGHSLRRHPLFRHMIPSLEALLLCKRVCDCATPPVLREVTKGGAKRLAYLKLETNLKQPAKQRRLVPQSPYQRDFVAGHQARHTSKADVSATSTFDVCPHLVCKSRQRVLGAENGIPRSPKQQSRED